MRQPCRNGGQPQAATYSRVSTEDQGERGTSLETQDAACLSLLTVKGYTVPPEYRILEEFTGATLERTGMAQTVGSDREAGSVSHGGGKIWRGPVWSYILASSPDQV